MPKLLCQHLYGVIVVVVYVAAQSCVHVLAQNAPQIEVIYPKVGQRINAIDSMFIFGNVTPGAQLTINDGDVKVYSNGAFLAFLPIAYGDFIFRLRAIVKSDTANFDLPVQAPTPYLPPTSDSIVILSDYHTPAGAIGLMVDDLLHVSFRGTPDCHAYFRLANDKEIRSMSEAPPEPQNYWAEQLFGSGNIPDSLMMRGVYSGTIGLTREHVSESIAIKYFLCRKMLSTKRIDEKGFPKDFRECGCIEEVNDNKLSVMDKSKVVVAELIDSVQTIRTGPGKGYLSIFQPRGVRFRITGHDRNWVRAFLAPDQEAWLPDTSIQILPAGTPLPRGEIALVRTVKNDDGVLISLDLGAKVPFRVDEDEILNRLTLDIYQSTSNIDWIRYDNRDDLVKLIRWSQPQAEIVRLTIDLNDELWGYDGYYVGNRFFLKLKSRPLVKGKLKGLRIVVDPGHSPDPGAVGPTGLLEKDANLAIALELAGLLQKRGADVYLTRDGDIPLPLNERPRIAYRDKADIFISVHNNALPDGVNPFVNNGTSTYYYHPHSRQLASFVLKKMVERTGYNDFGLYHANLAVDRPTGYLAILVECAFMMIPEHEMALREKSFQRRVALAIAEGLQDYLEGKKK